MGQFWDLSHDKNKVQYFREPLDKLQKFPGKKVGKAVEAKSIVKYGKFHPFLRLP